MLERSEIIQRKSFFRYKVVFGGHCEAGILIGLEISPRAFTLCIWSHYGTYRMTVQAWTGSASAILIIILTILIIILIIEYAWYCSLIIIVINDIIN